MYAGQRDNEMMYVLNLQAMCLNTIHKAQPHIRHCGLVDKELTSLFTKASSHGVKEAQSQYIYSLSFFLYLPISFIQIELTINASTELKMTSDSRRNSGKARYVKHCKCALPMILALKRFSLLIGPNDVVRYGVT